MSLVGKPGYQEIAGCWIPCEWVKSKLSELVDVIYGKSPAELQKLAAGIPIFGTGGVTGYTDVALYDGPSVILGRKGTIDKVQRSNGPFWAIDTTFYTTPKQNFDWAWLYYVMSSFDLRKLNEASGVPSIGRSSLESLNLAVPPFPEQQKIAAILTAVDDKLDVIVRQIEGTQTLKKYLMQTLFSRGVGTQDVAGRWIPHTEFKDSLLREIPLRWSVDKLDTHVTKVGSGVTPKGGSDAYLSSGIPLIRSQNVLVGRLSLTDVAFISDEQHQKMRNSALIPCDVLLNITGASIGRCAILPADFGEGNVNQHVCIIRPSLSLNPRYLCHYLNSSAGQKQIDRFQAGGNREGLNYQQIRSFDLPVPPPAEQQKIAEILDGVDDKLQTLVAKQACCKSLKRGLMQKLLTGEWRVKLDAPTEAA
nr:restriction endonuclease subunit S [Pseudomonas luteola]